MLKSIDLPNREFATKQELFSELWKHKDEIISLKKSAIYKSSEKGQFSYLNAEKAIRAVSKAGFEVKDSCIYPVISTTNYLDYHDDVHFDGSMNKTAKEQQGRIKYALDHELKYDSIIAWEKDVNMFTAKIDWSLVGKGYEGQTEGLVFEIEKDKIKRKDVLKDIEENRSDFENSIRMIYYKVVLGMDSNDSDHKDAKKYYDEREKVIVNRDTLEKRGFFWGVEELGIYKEGSLVTAGGSNDATSIYHKNTEAASSTSQPEPRKHSINPHFI
jgi:hypothetical protein